MLTIQNDVSTKTYLLTDYANPPYLKVNSTGYLPLTTETTSGLQLKVSRDNKTYRAVELSKSYVSAKTYLNNYIGLSQTFENGNSGWAKYTYGNTRTIREYECDSSSSKAFTRTIGLFDAYSTVTYTAYDYNCKNSSRETMTLASTTSFSSGGTRSEYRTMSMDPNAIKVFVEEMNFSGTTENSYSWSDTSQTYHYGTSTSYSFNIVTSSESISPNTTRITNNTYYTISYLYNTQQTNSNSEINSSTVSQFNVILNEEIREVATWT